jgi:hypothetical protein
MSAVSTTVLGIAGLGFTWWQWRASGFRPQCSAEVDGNRDAVRVQIRNKGRAPGVISDVAVVDDRGLDLDWPRFNGFRDGAYRATRLPGLDMMQLIIEAPEEHKFELAQKVFVEWGDSTTLALAPVDVGLFGLDSILPPQTETN